MYGESGKKTINKAEFDFKCSYRIKQSTGKKYLNESVWVFPRFLNIRIYEWNLDFAIFVAIYAPLG